MVLWVDHLPRLPSPPDRRGLDADFPGTRRMMVGGAILLAPLRTCKFFPTASIDSKNWLNRLSAAAVVLAAMLYWLSPPMTRRTEDKAPARRRLGFTADPYLLLALATLFWSRQRIVGRAIGGEVPPIGVSTVRCAAARPFVGFITYHVRRDWPLIRAHSGILLWLGIDEVGGALSGGRTIYRLAIRDGAQRFKCSTRWCPCSSSLPAESYFATA